MSLLGHLSDRCVLLHSFPEAARYLQHLSGDKRSIRERRCNISHVHHISFPLICNASLWHSTYVLEKQINPVQGNLSLYNPKNSVISQSVQPHYALHFLIYIQHIYVLRIPLKLVTSHTRWQETHLQSQSVKSKRGTSLPISIHHHSTSIHLQFINKNDDQRSTKIVRRRSLPSSLAKLPPVDLLWAPVSRSVRQTCDRHFQSIKSLHHRIWIIVSKY